MAGSGNAEATLQDEGHILARWGGHKSDLRGSAASEIDLMDGRGSIQWIMAPKRIAGSKQQFECEATMTHSA